MQGYEIRRAFLLVETEEDYQLISKTAEDILGNMQWGIHWYAEFIADYFELDNYCIARVHRSSWYHLDTKLDDRLKKFFDDYILVVMVEVDKKVESRFITAKVSGDVEAVDATPTDNLMKMFRCYLRGVKRRHRFFKEQLLKLSSEVHSSITSILETLETLVDASDTNINRVSTVF
jgi:hypothetical protein